MNRPDQSLIDSFLASLPPHKCELTIQHNPQRSHYESVREHLGNLEVDAQDFVSAEDYEAALAGDELWNIHWYPDTPVGFYSTYGTTLFNALSAAATALANA